MTEGIIAWPLQEEAELLFHRLASGDPVATADLAQSYLAPLVAHLRTVHPHADDHERQTAAEDAIISLCKNPAQYNPNLRSLGGYLRMSAEGDLKNLLASEGRHNRKRSDWDSVELVAQDGNGDDTRGDVELLSFDHPALTAVILALSDSERDALELMRAGERRTEQFATVLGLSALSPDERAVEVKRVKDRIKQRLKRATEGGS